MTTPVITLTPSADAAAWQALAALGAQKDEDGGPVWTVEVSIYQGRVKVRLRHSDAGLSMWGGGNTLAEAWLSASQRAEVEGKERMPSTTTR